MNEQQPNNAGNDLRAAMHWTSFIARTLATSMEVFLHRGFGERYLGMQALAVVPAVFFFTAFWRGHDVSPLLMFVLFYLGMCAAARARMLRSRAAGGPQEHSGYNGQPWLMRFWPQLSEERLKTTIEPALLLLIGLLVMPLNAPLGSYVMLGAVGMIVSVQMYLADQRARVLDMHDAHVEQQNVVEGFRHARGE